VPLHWCSSPDGCVSARAAGAALTIASFLSSAAMLGGRVHRDDPRHWYLHPPLDAGVASAAIVKVHFGRLVVRVVVVQPPCFFRHRRGSRARPSFRHYITSIDGISSGSGCVRLAGPALLCT